MSRARVETVAVLGRFQPFHWGHYEYLIHAAELGKTLIIGITNPDSSATRRSSTDPLRSLDSSNPFTYSDRCEMIRLSLEYMSPSVRVEFRPCDLRSPRLLRTSLGVCSLVAVTLYDEWSREKRELLEAAGYDVHVLWERREKLTSGTMVRDRLRSGRAWEHLVPVGTRRVISQMYGIGRLK